MSADYWNLTTTITCPACSKRGRWSLSTHFMGEFGSFQHTYTRNEAVLELLGVSVLLDGRIDAFRGECPYCETLYEIGARISKERVTKVWPLSVIEKLAIRSGAATKRWRGVTAGRNGRCVFPANAVGGFASAAEARPVPMNTPRPFSPRPCIHTSLPRWQHRRVRTEEPAMQTKPGANNTTAPAPVTEQGPSKRFPTRSPQVFYDKMVSRPDIREILTRLASGDKSERSVVLRRRRGHEG